METNLAPFIKDKPEGAVADRILRACVHCGFCNATCPTYQLLGDELDGPRGRIYQIKQLLEGGAVSAKTQLHLDRCLTCLNCQTTCPSGVEYGKLLDIGRELVDERVARPPGERLMRWLLRAVLPYPARFTPPLRLGQLVRPVLPSFLKHKVPPKVSDSGAWPTTAHTRKMILLNGCVQPAIAPNINAAAARVLDKLGTSAIRDPQAGCCGAISHHLGATDEAKVFMKRNIDAWWPHIEAGAEAIVMTASGCGSVVKEYGYLLQHDAAYADKAERVSALTKDLSEVLRDEDLSAFKPRDGNQWGQTRLISRNHLGSTSRKVKSIESDPIDFKIAFHPPCTLQHGQKLNGVVEKILITIGFTLVPVTDNHLCCGSAGTYSILQSELSGQLLDNKLRNLQQNEPSLIATANIGCLSHLQTKADVPVVHWVELLLAKAGVAEATS